MTTAVQGYSRSPILVAVKSLSLYAASHYWSVHITSSPFRSFAEYVLVKFVLSIARAHLFNTLVCGKTLNSRSQNSSSRNWTHRSFVSKVRIVYPWITSVTDGQTELTDERTDRTAVSNTWLWLGVVVSVVGRINEVNQHRARLVHDGWLLHG